jgi:hypothetical protein
MHSMRYYSGAIRYSRRLQYRAARTILAAALIGASGFLVADLLLRLA